MSEFLNFAEEKLEQLKAERNKISKPVVPQEFNSSEEPDNIQARLSHLTQCCPETANQEKEDVKEREVNFLNDLVLQLVDKYPKEIQDQILEKVKNSIF